MTATSRISIAEDAWLGHVVGYPVFRVECPRASGADPQDLDRAAEGLQAHAGAQARAMYYAKVDTADVGTVRALGRAGFYVVDVNVTLTFSHGHAPASQRGDLEVVDLRPEHAGAVLEIARTTFEYSRFHLDPQIPRAIADRVKHDWILSYVNGARGDRLFVATFDGEPAGFLASLCGESSGQRTATIDLVGVSRAFRRRGVGLRLVDAFIDAYRDACTVLQVGTQVANIPSLRLYESIGFVMHRSTYVMHNHVGVAG